MKDIDILIIHLNGEEVIHNCLKSIFEDDSSANVKLLFNATTDDSQKNVEEKFPKVKSYCTKKRWGFAQASNFLAKKSKNKYVIFLNNDLTVEKNWAVEMLKTLKRNKNCVAVQSKIKSFYKRSYFEYAGAAGGFIDKWGYPFCRGRIFGNVEKDNGQFDDETRIFWGCGVSLLVERDYFIKIGMFDELFFMYAEELDLCWRLNNTGKEVWYSPKSVISHIGSFSVNKEKINFKKECLISRNHTLALIKNNSLIKLAKLLPVKILLEIVASLRFPLKRGIPFIVSIPSTCYYFIRRKKIKCSEKNIEFNGLVYPKSIALDYFIKNKKIFKDLEFGEGYE